MNEKFSHTPGKLVISSIGVGFEIESEAGEVIAQAQQVTSQDHMQGLAIRKENARRLSACWNACEGISTEALESVTHAALGWSRTASKLIKATRQRDELLAALKLAYAALVNSSAKMDHYGEPKLRHSQAEKIALEAIAQATGKTSEAA